MIELPSNLILEKTLNNSLKVGSLHHAVLIHGENHTGKLALALQLASHLLCQENLANPCQTCQQCLSMLYLQNPHLILADRSEREHNIKFLSYLLKVAKEEKKQWIYEKIQFEVRLLINRHRQQYYKTVKKVKSSQPELIKINDKDLEKLLHTLYLKIEKPFNEGNQFLTEEFYKSIKLVQNSLDRSVLIKESVLKIFSKLDLKTSNNRVFILEHIDLIHHDIVPSLLKKLEEPPANVYFILLNDSSRTINQTVLKPLNSRCIKLNLTNNTYHFKNYYEKLAGLSLEENDMECTNPFDFVSNKLSHFDVSLFETPNKLMQYIDETKENQLDLDLMIKKLLNYLQNRLIDTDKHTDIKKLKDLAKINNSLSNIAVLNSGKSVGKNKLKYSFLNLFNDLYRNF